MGIRVSNVTVQNLFLPTDIFQTVNDPITFIQEPFARKLRVSNLTVQVLQLQSGRFLFANDDLGLSDLVLVLNDAGSRQPVEDVIGFTDEVFAASNPFIDDVLMFTQNARPSILNHDVDDDLNLRDQVETCPGAPWSAIEIVDTIEFVQVGGKAEEATASNTLALTDTIDIINGVEGDGHVLDLVQNVSVGKGQVVSSEIEFTEEVMSFSDFLRVVEDADVVEHALTYYIDNGCNRKQYARFIGEGSADPISEQGLVFDSSFVLESIDDGTVLVLRSPETDDGDRIGFNRVNRETRGGELNVFSDPDWAEVNTLLFTITALTDGDGNCPDALGQTLQFLQDNLGKEIFLHDWTGTSWRGVITTPDEAATEDADGYWTVTFEFEGIAQSGSVPNSVLSFSDQMTFNADWARPLSDTLALMQAVTVGGDRYFSLSDDLGISDSISGSILEHTELHDDFTAGSAVDLEGTSPTTGTGTWRAHEEFQDDGTLDSPVDAGAYYQFTPVDGTVYELTFTGANVDTFSEGDNTIWGFYEDQSANDMISGPVADGTLNPTAAKAVHLMRTIDGGSKEHSFRRGSDSDGTADTQQWTDATLRASPDDVLDLRLTLDTTNGAGEWTIQWEAKTVISPTYTEVGAETSLLSENIGAVGWSMDSANTDVTLDQIRLTELRPVA